MTRSDAEGIRRAVAARKVAATAVCTDALERIDARNPELNAFLTVAREQALAHARRLDQPDADVASLPLAGVPIALKDNICTRGLRTTAGSRMLENYVPPYSATVVDRLEAAGAVVVGKTNCDEFAMGSSTEHSAFGPTRNPHALDRTPGGSSGGSAVAVAAGLTCVALGSETGGSVRQPAALCGVVGLKPTYGRVSRYGLIAFSSSMDQIGVFATSAVDAARVLRVIAGEDAKDATAAKQPVDDYEAAARSAVRGLRVGVPRAFLADGIDKGVRESFEQALDRLRAQGMAIQDVTLPHARYATPTYAIVAMAEASSNLARFDGVRYGHRGASLANLRELYGSSRAAFGKEVKRRLLLGTYVLSGGYYDAYYAKAQDVRALMRRDYDQAFADVDLVATPTSPTTAFPLGARVEDPLQMYLADVFTAAANLTGLPAISVPCGSADGLPVGLQLTGRMWEEGTLLRAAAVFDRGPHQP